LCRGARTQKGKRTGNKTEGIDHHDLVDDTRFFVDLVTNQVFDTSSIRGGGKTSSRAGMTIVTEEIDNEPICLVAPDPKTWYCGPEDPEFKKFSELFSRSIRLCAPAVKATSQEIIFTNRFLNTSFLEKEDLCFLNHRFVCRVAYQLGIDPNQSNLVLDYIESLDLPPANEKDKTLLPLDKAFPYVSPRDSRGDCPDQTGNANCSDFDHCVGRFYIFMNSIFFGMGTHHQVNQQRSYTRKKAGEWCFYFWYRKYFGGN